MKTLAPQAKENVGRAAAVRDQELQRNGPDVDQSTATLQRRTPSLDLQAKLQIGERGDKYEQEADRIADEVVTDSPSREQHVIPPAEPTIQKRYYPTITPLQRQAEPEDELQKQDDTEEDVQAKEDDAALQMSSGADAEAPAEDPVPLQRQPEAEDEMQMQEDEEEEEIQTKEDEPLQLSSDAPPPDDDDAVQPKPITGHRARTLPMPGASPIQCSAGHRPSIATRTAARPHRSFVQARRQATNPISIRGPPIPLQRSTVEASPSPSLDDAGPIASATSPQLLQTKPSTPARTAVGESELERKLRASRSGGQELPEPIQVFMEEKIGADFSGVRVHTSNDAMQMNRRLGAQAFTHGKDIFFNAGRFKPESRDGQRLLAHELVHTVQQGAVPKRVQRSADARAPPIEESTTEPMLQGGWLGDALNEYAEELPGWFLVTVVVGYNPLTERDVDRTPQNFLRGVMGLIPMGTSLYDKLNEEGLIDQGFEWLENQLEELDLNWDRLRDACTDAWDDMDFVRLDPFDYNMRVFHRYFDPIWDDVETLGDRVIDKMVELVRETMLTPLVDFIKERTRAYPLLRVILGEDPVTGEQVDSSLYNIVSAFLMLTESGEEYLNKLNESGKLQELSDWLDAEIEKLDISLETITNAFSEAWDLLDIDAVLHPIDTFRSLYNIFSGPVTRLFNFVVNVAMKVLGLIKDWLLGLLKDYANDIPGYPLLRVILGSDPLTGEEVPRTAENFIMGFLSFVPDGRKKFEDLKESGALEKMFAWLEDAIAQFGLVGEAFLNAFTQIWESFTINDLADPVGAFVRVVEIFTEPVRMLLDFAIEVGVKILEFIFEGFLLISGPFGQRILDTLKRTESVFKIIWKDPVAFASNIIAAVKKGMDQFVANILIHLRDALIGWLFGSVADMITMPDEFNAMGILDLALQLMGLTYDNFRAQLVERIGEENVARLETAFEFVQVLVTEGLAAAWQKLLEFGENIIDGIIEGVKEMVIESIIKIGMQKLAMLLAGPYGAIVEAIITTYNFIKTLIERINQIMEFVNGVLDSIEPIARGDIAGAANFVEQSLKRGLTLLISFLAGLIGLGGIPRKVREVVLRMHDAVSRAMGAVIDWVIARGRALFGMSSEDEQGEAEGGTLDAETTFEDSGGEGHRLFFRRDGSSYELMMASDNPRALRERINQRKNAQGVAEPQVRACNEALDELSTLDSYVAANKEILENREHDQHQSKVSHVESELNRIKANVIEAGVDVDNTQEEDDMIAAIRSEWPEDAFMKRDAKARIVNDSIRPGTIDRLFPILVEKGRLFRQQSNPNDPHKLHSLQRFPSPVRSIPSASRRHLFGYDNPAHNSPTGRAVLGRESSIDWENTEASPDEVNLTSWDFLETARYKSWRTSTRNISESNAVLGHRESAGTHWNNGVSGNGPGMHQTRSDNMDWNKTPSIYGGVEERHESSSTGAGEERYNDPDPGPSGPTPVHESWWNPRHSQYPRIGGYNYNPRGLPLPKLIQAKRDARHEREADEAADHVIEGIDSDAPRAPPRIHRLPLQTSAKTDNDAPSEMVTPGSTSAGSSIDEPVRTEMESGFSADFSDVRIHTDSDSVQMNRDMQAKAFTYGNDIYFNEGQYDPSSTSGKHLLAHELTHTVQQGTSSQQAVQRKETPDAKPAAEEEKKEDSGPPVLGSASIPGLEPPAEEPTKEAVAEAKEAPLDPEASKEKKGDAKGKAPEVKGKETEPKPEEEEGKGKGKKKDKGKGKEGEKKEKLAEVKTLKLGGSSEGKLESFTNSTASQMAANIDAFGGAVADSLDKEQKAEAKNAPVIVASTTGKGNLEKGEGGPEVKAKEGQIAEDGEKQKKPTPKEPKHKDLAAPVKNEKNNKVLDQQGSTGFIAWFKNRIGSFMGSVSTTDPGVNTSAGERPKVDLKGESDPKRADKQRAEGDKQVAGEKDKVQAKIKANPGKEKIQPLKVDEPNKTPLVPTAIEKAETKQNQDMADYLAVPMPESVRKKADAGMKPLLEKSMSKPRKDARKAANKRDSDKKTEVASAKAKADAENAKAKKNQDDMVAEKRNEVAQQQKDGIKEADDKMKEFDKEANGQQKSLKKEIDTRVTKDQKKAADKLKEGEKEAEKEKKKGEQEAKKKKREAERKQKKKSWWDRVVDAIKSVVKALTKAIDTIFNAVRKAVKWIIEKVKKAALAIIEAARKWIVEQLNKFRKFLKDMVTKYIGKYFPELAKRINKAIDKVVDNAIAGVNAVADGLKKAVTAICDALGKALDKILSVFQTALKATVQIVGAVLTGDFAEALKIAFMAACDIAGIDPKSIMNFIEKAGNLIGKIFKDPAAFFSNVARGVKKGIDQFVANIKKHLINGLIAWLTGAMGDISITLPVKFTLKGILKLAMEILGLTYANIRAKVVKKLGPKGEKIVSTLEKTFEFVKLLVTKGPSAILEKGKEMLAGFKDKVLAGIRNIVTAEVVKAGVVYLISMLNPASALVKAIKMLYDLVMFFVNRWDQIKAFANSVFNSVSALAAGNIGKAANAVEQALARSIPAILGLLASLLGLNGIGTSVQKLLKRIRKPIDNAIDKVVGFVVKKGKALFKKGKAAVKKGVQAVVAWWKVKWSFKNKAGESHTLYFKGSGKSAKLMIRSDPKTFTEYINSIKPQTPEETRAHGQAKTIATKIDSMKKTESTSNKKGQFQKNDVAKGYEQKLKELAGVLRVFQSREQGEIPPTSAIRFAGLTAQQFGRGVTVDKLTKKGPPGSQPQVTSRWWRTLTMRKKGKGSYYIRGHLLNHNVHGTGTNWKNLTPLTRSANSNMETTFETHVKKSVDAGNAVYFKVTPIYGASTPGVISQINAKPGGLPPKYNANDLKVIKQIAQVEANISRGVTCEAKEYDPFKDKNTKAPKQVIPGGKVSVSVVNTIAANNITDYDLVPSKAPEPGRIDNAAAMKNAGVDDDHADQIAEKVRKINTDEEKRVNTVSQLAKALPALASAIQSYYKSKLIKFQTSIPE